MEVVIQVRTVRMGHPQQQGCETQFCQKASSELPGNRWLSDGNSQCFGRSLLKLNYFCKTSVLSELVKIFFLPL